MSIEALLESDDDYCLMFSLAFCLSGLPFGSLVWGNWQSRLSDYAFGFRLHLFTAMFGLNIGTLSLLLRTCKIVFYTLEVIMLVCLEQLIWFCCLSLAS